MSIELLSFEDRQIRSVSDFPDGGLSMADSPIVQELAFFERNRSTLLERHAGKFVLVKGEELIGAYDSAENAYAAGVDKFGDVPMLIKRVQASDPEAALPALHLGLIGAHP